MLCKQRAPLFDSDQKHSTPIMAESTLREAMHYARTAHLSAEAEQGRAPVLYMNGWDVFDALPHLWHPSIDQLPGTIDNRTVPEYTALHKRFKLDTDDAIVRRARGLCKLFVGPVGAITRIHQDNHEAHAWLHNIRGRKLYVLCKPDEASSNIVAPSAVSGTKNLGTKYEGRLDPLDPLQQSRVQKAGLELFATVLEPGQTIVAPSGWWHYAVSLTPTITLMCNFWDKTNLQPLHDMFFDGVSRAFDAGRREAAAKPGAPPLPTSSAASKAPLVEFSTPVTYRTVHGPWVYIRSHPSTEAPMLGCLRQGRTVEIGASQDGWLRTASPFSKGEYGWALEDGAPINLGVLLRPLVDAIAG